MTDHSKKGNGVEKQFKMQMLWRMLNSVPNISFLHIPSNSKKVNGKYDNNNMPIAFPMQAQ